MKVQVVLENGYDQALLGMSYSFKDREMPVEEFWTQARQDRAQLRASKLAPMGNGHNKFLRQICLWVDIEAPRCWWSEFDTYKVGTVAQSESTMHTLAKRAPTKNDFDEYTPPGAIIAFIEEWEAYQAHKNLARLKCALPEGFLQRRMVTFNYETVRALIRQRDYHKLVFWHQFLEQLLPQLKQQELLADLLEAQQ